MIKFKWTSLVLLLLVSTAVCSQSKKEEELSQKFWADASTDKTVTETPQKWKDQSAVILYKELFYGYTNNGKKMYNPSYIHQRIKMLDQAAVEYFSEFSFEQDSRVGGPLVNLSREQTYIGAKIVKPDGEEVIVDVKAELVAQDDLNKLAIPGLAINDILDIYVYEDDYERSSGTYIYDPVEMLLSDNYPILHQKIAVEVENDYFLNMESYNGAPAVIEETTDRKATRRYALIVKDIPPTEVPRWSYPINQLPAIKFQVVFALKMNDETRAGAFLDKDDANRKTGVSTDEIVGYYDSRFQADSRKELKDVIKYIESQNIADKREQLEAALYYIRHMSYNRFIEMVVAMDNQITNPYDMPCEKDYVILNENKFVTYMAGLAKQLEIDYDIVIATAAYNGSIQDLLLRSNVSYGLRFNFDKPLYFFDLGPHVQANLFPSELEGTEFYRIDVRKNRSLEEITQDVLPATTADQNKTNAVVDVHLKPDFSGFDTTRNFSFFGQEKVEELSQKMLFVDFIDEEYEYFGTRHFYDCKKRQSKDDQQIEQKLKTLYSTIRQRHAERLTDAVNMSLSISDYDYSIVESGRFSDVPFKFKDQFSLGNELIKKAGPNYIINVGRFIQGQVKLAEEERQRDLNVHLNYAKSFNYEVRINIPEGYEVKGLDKLNFDISNQTGQFKSSARIKGDQLVYTTSKVYAKNLYTPQEWQQMLPWLDAAYEFSQANVLFKKI